MKIKSSKLKVQSLEKGLTYIELLLYTAVVTIMLSSVIPFAWDVIGGGVKSSIQQEVYSQARYVSERIKYEIRNANGINNVNVPAGSISLDTTTDPTTVIDSSGGKVRIKYGSAPVIDLNADNTSVSALTFTDYRSGDGKTQHIGFSFTMSSSYGSLRSEYQDSTVVRGSAERRSN